ncbi:MAG: hypothetical protein MPJ50_03615 [Pirellulales bacterium]|nr:hypothetical protein [Pirellulales bacterium]
MAMSLTDYCLAQTEPLARETLARYVPPNAGLFLEIHRLPAGLERYARGPLYKRLKTFPAWSEWIKAEADAIDGMSVRLAEAFGMTWETFERDIAGGQIALASWPISPPSNAQAANHSPDASPAGSTLLIVQALRADSLAKLVEGFRALQATAGVVWMQESVSGVNMLIGSTEPDARKVRYSLAVIDRTAIVCDSPSLCRRVIGLHRAVTDDQGAESLADLDSFQQSQTALPDSVHLFAFLNPVPWQNALAKRIADGKFSEGEQAQQQATLDLWQSLTYGAAGIQLGREFELSSVFQFDKSRMPPKLGGFLRSAAGNSRMVQALPRNCLASVAIHLDLTRLPDLLLDQSDTRQVNPIFRQIFAALGPEFGAHLTEVSRSGNATGQTANSRANAEEPFPLAWVFEMGWRPTLSIDDLPQDSDTMFREAMPEVLNLAYRVTSSSLFANLHTLVDQGAQLTSLQEWTLFAAGGESTTFGLKDGYLLASAASQAVAEFRSQDATSPLVANAEIRRMLERPFLGGEPNQVLLLNCRGLRELLSRRGAEIAAGIEAAQSVSNAEAQLAVTQMAQVLQLADYISASARVTEDRLAIAILISAEDD